MRLSQFTGAIQPTDLAVLPVNAHDVFDPFEFDERSMNRAAGRLLVRVRRSDRYVAAKGARSPSGRLQRLIRSVATLIGPRIQRRATERGSTS